MMAAHEPGDADASGRSKRAVGCSGAKSSNTNPKDAEDETVECSMIQERLVYHYHRLTEEEAMWLVGS